MVSISVVLTGVAAAVAIIAFVVSMIHRRADQQHQEILRVQQSKDARINGVVAAYAKLERSCQSSNLLGMLKAGVLSLESSDEVREANLRIIKLGISPGVPNEFAMKLEGADLLRFFNLVNEHYQETRMLSNRVVLELIQKAKEGVDGTARG